MSCWRQTDPSPCCVLNPSLGHILGDLHTNIIKRGQRRRDPDTSDFSQTAGGCCHLSGIIINATRLDFPGYHRLDDFCGEWSKKSCKWHFHPYLTKFSAILLQWKRQILRIHNFVHKVISRVNVIKVLFSLSLPTWILRSWLNSIEILCGLEPGKGQDLEPTWTELSPEILCH